MVDKETDGGKKKRMVAKLKTVKRLTAKEWKALEAKTGKSAAILKAFEGVIAHYGDEALIAWHFHNGLRDEKPRYRVKAVSSQQ